MSSCLVSGQKGTGYKLDTEMIRKSECERLSLVNLVQLLSLEQGKRLPRNLLKRSSLL